MGQQPNRQPGADAGLSPPQHVAARGIFAVPQRRCRRRIATLIRRSELRGEGKGKVHGLPAANEMEVHQIYEASFEGNFPKMAVSLVARSFPEASVVLADHDSGAASRGFILRRGPLADDPDPTSPHGFAHHWRLPVGHVYHEGDLLEESGHTGSAHRNNLRPDAADDEDPVGIVGVVIRRHMGRQMVLEFRFRLRKENSLRPAMQSWLARMTPHMMRGVRISDLRSRAVFETALTPSVLELSPFAVFLIDGARNVLKKNRRADRLASGMESLFVSADDRLHATEPESDAQFSTALHLLQNTPTLQSHQLVFRRGRDDGMQLLTIAKLAVRTTDCPLDGAGEGESAGHFAVIAHNCAETLNLSQHTLWSTFGLSTREAELAASLLNGESIGEYASRRQISKQTLRNQLGGIMRKTATNRQPELVNLLTRLALTVPY